MAHFIQNLGGIFGVFGQAIVERAVRALFSGQLDWTVGQGSVKVIDGIDESIAESASCFGIEIKVHGGHGLFRRDATPNGCSLQTKSFVWTEFFPAWIVSWK